MKIYILGPSGSGKSYLASKLADIYKIPHIEIDSIWTKYGGKELYRSQPHQFVAEKDKLRAHILKEVKQLTANKNWVVDGNYSYIREALLAEADTLILIRPSRMHNACNLLKRQLSGDNRRRGYGLRDFIFHFPLAYDKHNVINVRLHNISKTHSNLKILESRSGINAYIKKILCEQ